MNASASGADRLDIRVGDLVKGTRKVNPEDTATGRVLSIGTTSAITGRFYFDLANWDLEVLDRPLPPIDEELLNGTINAWRKGYYGYGPIDGAFKSSGYAKALTAVINYLREHDTYNKESK